MKILNVSAKEVPSCCVFSYKGYKISASTIFKPNSIIVYQSENEMEILYDATSIEDAIVWIDKQDQEPKNMTVRELIELLSRQDWDAEILFDDRKDFAPVDFADISKAIEIKSISAFSNKGRSTVTLNRKEL